VLAAKGLGAVQAFGHGGMAAGLLAEQAGFDGADRVHDRSLAQGEILGRRRSSRCKPLFRLHLLHCGNRNPV
jgi:hypothetical protein